MVGEGGALARVVDRIGPAILIALTISGAAFGQAPAVALLRTSAPCTPGRLDSVEVRAVPDRVAGEVWAAYGNDNGRTDDWTGADGTYSVPLPDGRVVWMFSDTFLGVVDPDGTRPPGTPLINNDYVIQREGALRRTLHGGTAAHPEALIVPADADWYWVSDATVEGNRLRQFVSKFERTGPGAWDWEWVGTDVASFSLPGLRLTGITAVPASNGVDYGVALLEEPDYTYIYGVEDLAVVKYMHLARARRGSLLGSWEYWDGSGWSSDPADSARITSGVSNSYSVLRVGPVYVLITQDSTMPFGSEIVAHLSCQPQGPWTHPTHVYTTPESGGDLFTYNAVAHPELTDRRGMLVSYNVNTFDGSQLFEDVTIYRPRFIRVKVTA